jgi:hypothetical protein
MKIKIIESVVKKADTPRIKFYYEKCADCKLTFHYMYIGIIWLNRTYLIIITNE